MSVYEPWDAGRGAEIIAEHTHLEGATLVILHALQEAFGYVPEAAVPMVAEALNLSRAEEQGEHCSFPHRTFGVNREQLSRDIRDL